MTRIERLRGRIERIEHVLHGCSGQHRDRLVDWVADQLRAGGVVLDPARIDELAEAEFRRALGDLEDLIDAEVRWPEPLDTLLDLGVDVALDIIAATVFRRRRRLARRLARLQARLHRLLGAG